MMERKKKVRTFSGMKIDYCENLLSYKNSVRRLGRLQRDR